ncbi:MAG: S-formylglutathione hydrolase [Deltaproteobacteria bacterium]
MKTVSTNRIFGGTQGVYEHESTSTNTPMRFSVYVPDAARDHRLPVVMFLSGLTCTEQNFTTKAGAQRAASKHGLILVAPDTSPRGEGVADDDAYDLGQGAGFYVNATEAPWAAHFSMYDYVTSELIDLVRDRFAADVDRLGVTGHSMGGHGALIVALKNPDRFKSVSAFAPICHPTAVPWGKKAFSAYLGADESKWGAYDACSLIEGGAKTSKILVDQGEADNFLEAGQLEPQDLEAACAAAGQPLELRRQAGYDHSYYFIASFVDDHLAHHAAILGA